MPPNEGLRRGFLAFVRQMRAHAGDTIARELTRGTPAAMVHHLLAHNAPHPGPAWEALELGMHSHLLSAYGEAHTAAQVYITRRVAKSARRRRGIVVPANPKSLKWIKQRAGDQITRVSNETVEVIREKLLASYERGVNVRALADEIQRYIGLTARQAKAVDNYRARLDDEEDMSEAHADGLADAYAEKQLQYRAEMIARTETKDAQEEGRLASWTDAQADGDLPDSAKKTWDYFGQEGSDRECEICQSLDGQSVGLDEEFEDDDGETYDRPPAHPDCRCSLELDAG